MKPSVALELHRETIRELARRHRVKNARVFGSAAAGTDSERSDLDLLVDPGPGTTLFDLGGLQADLEDATGVRVHLVTPGDLPARFRDDVVRKAVQV